jgi:hypothetical protein
MGKYWRDQVASWFFQKRCIALSRLIRHASLLGIQIKGFTHIGATVG